MRHCFRGPSPFSIHDWLIDLIHGNQATQIWNVLLYEKIWKTLKMTILWRIWILVQVACWLNYAEKNSKLTALYIACRFVIYYIMFYFYFILFYWWTKQQSYLCHIFNCIVQYNFPLLYCLRYWTSRKGQGTCFLCTYNIPGTVLTPATNQNWSRFLSWVAINSWKQIVLKLKLNEP